MIHFFKKGLTGKKIKRLARNLKSIYKIFTIINYVGIRKDLFPEEIQV
jgi:hypothetical protein